MKESFSSTEETDSCPRLPSFSSSSKLSLALHKQLAKSKSPRDQAALQAQIDATDTQIDALVYDLYGLTAAEITHCGGRRGGMRIYLDVSCLNRPFDDQTQVRIRLESEAVLAILHQMEGGFWSHISSGMAEIEIRANRDEQRRAQVALLCRKKLLLCASFHRFGNVPRNSKN